MLLKLYRLLTFVFAPLIDLYLKQRMAQGKEDEIRFAERLGRAALARPKGPLLWIHAASIGESLSVLPLIQRLNDTYKMHILLTTGTVTSAKMVESKLPDNAFHQYVPVDRIMAVARFLRHWKPDLAFWVESEFWPNLTTETQRYCPMILLNGRISENSFRNWERYQAIGEKVLQCFTLCLPQSSKDAERLKKLGAPNVNYIGNLKCDAPPLPADPKKMGALVTQIGQRPLWLAASTHKGEELIAAKTHKALKEDHPDLLTIIAPRHPKRKEEIREELEDLGLEVVFRSEGQEVAESTDIYIADTLGELGVFYRLAPIVFVGGSLCNHGGQNPLEAARLECAIIVGPSTENFADVVKELDTEGAIATVKDQKELQHTLHELWIDQERQDQLAGNALNVVERKMGVLDSYMEALGPYIDKIAKRKHAKGS